LILNFYSSIINFVNIQFIISFELAFTIVLLISHLNLLKFIRVITTSIIILLTILIN